MNGIPHGFEFAVSEGNLRSIFGILDRCLVYTDLSYSE